MVTLANYKQLLTHFESKPNDIRIYFGSFPELLVKYEWDVPISYVFTRIEAAKHNALYTGLVRIHWLDSSLTRELLEKDHMSRGRFKELFEKVYGEALDSDLGAKLSAAEAVRDKIAHGRWLKAAQARQGLADAFDFAEEFSDYLVGLRGVRPFDSLRGFKGRAESLPKETTRWVLRGMGVPPPRKQPAA